MSTRPTLHRVLDPDQLARIFGDDHREDHANAYDWLNRRKPSALRGFVNDLRANLPLTITVAAAGIAFGALLTVGIAYFIAWLAF